MAMGGGLRGAGAPVHTASNPGDVNGGQLHRSWGSEPCFLQWDDGHGGKMGPHPRCLHPDGNRAGLQMSWETPIPVPFNPGDGNRGQLQGEASGELGARCRLDSRGDLLLIREEALGGSVLREGTAGIVGLEDAPDAVDALLNARSQHRHISADRCIAAGTQGGCWQAVGRVHRMSTVNPGVGFVQPPLVSEVTALLTEVPH